MTVLIAHTTISPTTLPILHLIVPILHLIVHLTLHLIITQYQIIDN